jgi:anti-anti-sigma factor
MRARYAPNTHRDPAAFVIDRPDSGTGTLRMALHGDVDALSGGQVQEAVVDVLHRQHPSRIEMDVREVTFLDSAGIRTLLLCHNEAERLNCRLTVVEAPHGVYRVLEISGLLDHFGLA